LLIPPCRLFPVASIRFRVGVRPRVPFFVQVGHSALTDVYFGSDNNRTDRRRGSQRYSKYNTYKHDSGAFRRGEDSRLHEVVIRQRLRPKKAKKGLADHSSVSNQSDSAASSPTSTFGSETSSCTYLDSSTATYGDTLGFEPANLDLKSLDTFIQQFEAHLSGPTEVDEGAFSKDAAPLQGDCSEGSDMSMEVGAMAMEYHGGEGVEEVGSTSVESPPSGAVSISVTPDSSSRPTTPDPSCPTNSPLFINDKQIQQPPDPVPPLPTEQAVARDPYEGVSFGCASSAPFSFFAGEFPKDVSVIDLGDYDCGPSNSHYSFYATEERSNWSSSNFNDWLPACNAVGPG
jgi:hypothetical protein